MSEIVQRASGTGQGLRRHGAAVCLPDRERRRWMRIACLGGGPAGLYVRDLHEAARSGHEIDLFERNRPDDTFGWGVVFSTRRSRT
jgi:NADPH-dependent glutamate synthase beta subunit-like oxidoreductase